MKIKISDWGMDLPWFFSKICFEKTYRDDRSIWQYIFLPFCILVDLFVYPIHFIDRIRISTSKAKRSKR